MKKLALAVLLLLVMSGGAYSQTFTAVSFDAGYGCFQTYFTSSVEGLVTLAYGETSALGTSFTRGAAVGQSGAVAVGGKSQMRPICGLKPSTTYLVKLSIPTGTDWDCRVAPATGNNGTTVGCDATTGYGTVTTTALPPGFGTYLELWLPDVSGLPTKPPTVTPGKTWTVTTPGSAAQLSAALDACVAGTGFGQVGEVIVPPGPKYVINKALGATAGMCLVHPPNVDTALPPDGVRTGPMWKAAMPRLEAPIAVNGHWADVDTGTIYGHGASGWYFLGINFSTPDTPNITDATEYTVTGVTADGKTLTLNPAPAYDSDMSPNRVVQVKDVTGTWIDPPNGPAIVSSQNQPAGTITLNITARPNAAWVSGGKVRASLADNICDASNTAPIVITTCRPHYYANHGDIPITSISGNAVNVPSGHMFPSGTHYMAWIKGATGATEYNGFWRTTSTGATVINLTAGPGTSCASNCGTIRWLVPIAVQGVQGNTAANGLAYYDVTDSTHVTLLYNNSGPTAGNGAYTGGGVIAQEPLHMANTIGIDKTSSRVHFDRCYFEGGYPRRVSQAMLHHGSDSSIINNYFDDIQFYRLAWVGAAPFNLLGTALYTMNVQDARYIAGTVAIENTNGPNKLIENNYLEAHGITVFTQDPPTPVGNPFPSNIVIRRNTFYADLNKAYGLVNNQGLYYVHRHHWELKRGERYLVEGNIFDGGWADFNSCGPVTMITPVTGQNYTRDLWFRYNTFQRITEGFYAVGVDSNTNNQQLMSKRLRFSDNLFRDMNGNRVSQITNINGTLQYCGHPFRMELGNESVQIEHNTFEMPFGGAAMSPIEIRNAFYSGLIVRNNISYINGADGSYNSATPYNITWDSGRLASSPDPSTKGTERAAFDFAFGPSSVWSHNYMVPGVRATPADYDSITTGYPAGKTRTYNECAVAEPSSGNRAMWSGFKGMNCGGNVAGGDTANQKRNFVKWLNPVINGDYRLSHLSPALASTRIGRVLTVSGGVTAGGVVTVGPGHAMQVGYTVVIANSTTTALNGSWVVSQIATNTFTITGYSGGACTTTCGGATVTSIDARITSDGRDPGVDNDLLEQTQGRVKGGTQDMVTTTTTTATIPFTAPDSVGCPVEYSLLPQWGTGQRAADPGGNRTRSVTITGLTSQTLYYYRVLCAVQQPSGVFTTK